MLEPFNVLNDAWSSARPIVPLYGAGISVGSGIPTTAGLIDYLCKVVFLNEYFSPLCTADLSTTIGRSRCGHGHPGLVPHSQWPSPPQLNADLALLVRHPETREMLAGVLGPRLLEASSAPLDMIKDFVLDEERRRAHPDIDRMLSTVGLEKRREALSAVSVPWTRLLARATGDQQDQIDGFFDRIVRARNPCAAHHYSGFLTRLLDVPLVLTTNFDDLLERSMRMQGIEATTFEIQTSGMLPDPALVRSHRAILKLHGGSHGLRADSTLDRPLTESEVGRFCQYVPGDAVLVVVGYSGAELRVQSLINALLESSEGSRTLLWIHRNPAKPQYLQELHEVYPEQVKSHPYRDAGLFLQEAYERIGYAHPVSGYPYRALPQVSPWIPTGGRESVGSDSKNGERILVFSGYPGTGTSTALARYTRSLERTHHAIWLDLEELPSVTSLCVVLLQEIREHDPELPSVLLPTEIPGIDADPVRPSPALIRRIAEGLARSRFVVALDSVHEFCQGREGRDAQIVELGKVVYEIAQQVGAAGGDSRVGLSLNSSDDERGIYLPFEGRLEHRDERIVSYLKVGGHRAAEFNDIADRQLAAFEALLNVAPGNLRNYPRIDELVRERWDEFDPTTRRLLMLASAFRRPRSIVAFRQLIAPRDEDKSQALEEMLGSLARARILIQREGGFYWMHRSLRNWIVEKLKENTDELDFSAVHEKIAWYYLEDVFFASGEIQAFMEYVYHRMESAKYGSSADSVPRFRALIRALTRQRNFLLSNGHSETLMVWIEDIKRVFDEYRARASAEDQHGKELSELSQEIDSSLSDLKSTVVREAQGFQSSIRIDVARLQQCLPRDSPELVRGKSGRYRILTPLKQVLRDAHGDSQIENVLQALTIGERVLNVGRSCSGLREFADAHELLLISKAIATNALRSGNPTILSRARRLSISSGLQAMSTVLNRVDPNEYLGSSAQMPIENALGDADSFFRRCMAEMRQLSTSDGLDAERLRGAFYTQRARRFRLSSPPNLDRANRYLNQAEASVRGGGMPARESAMMLAIIGLRRTENLLTQLEQDSTQVGISPRFHLLGQASQQLGEVDQRIDVTRTNVWWWTLRCLLSARVYCELIRLWCDYRTLMDQRSSQTIESCSLGQAEFKRLEGADPMLWLYEALVSLSSGLDNVQTDEVRKEALIGTWGLLKGHHDVVRSRVGSLGAGEWDRLNERAGLSWAAPALDARKVERSRSGESERLSSDSFRGLSP